jgi:hypothetical protein
MTVTYTFPTEISMNLEYLADIFYDATMDYISDNCEVEEIPKEIKLQILKDAARYVLANF